MQATHLCVIRPVWLTKNLSAVIELLQVLNWARSEVVNHGDKIESYSHQYNRILRKTHMYNISIERKG